MFVISRSNAIIVQHLVSAADLAGEAGPIDFYPNANDMTGRAALMQIADNLILHNKLTADRFAPIADGGPFRTDC